MIEVEYIDHMGTDGTVVSAARVSYAKDQARVRGGWEIPDDGEPVCHDPELPAKDVRLVAYLAKHGHFTPFTHPQITLRITAPIFVARQCFKSKVGFTENEVSRRYVDDPPAFYAPTVWRGRPIKTKQGSSDVPVLGVEIEPDVYVTPGLLVEDCYRTCRETYDALIKAGVAPEQARMVLPQAMLTSWYWTGSLAAYGRFCGLRMAPDAQAETREVALGCAEIIAPLFPVSWAALAGWQPSVSETGDAA